MEILLMDSFTSVKLSISASAVIFIFNRGIALRHY